MKTTIKQTLALLTVVTGFAFISCNSSETSLATPTEMPKEKSLRHVVMFQFKADATPEQIKKIEEEFSKLPNEIDTITDYEWGTNVSKEDKDQGFTHCFIVSFKDQAGLDVYGPHPAHQAFVKVLLPSLEKVLVLDFFTK